MREGVKKESIKDVDVSDWMQTLREGGFSDEEIDSVLTHSNKTYAGLKKGAYIEKEIQKMNEEIRQRRGIGFSPKEIENIRKGIESRFRS